MNKLLELAKTKLGCGYVLGSQGQIMTQSLLDSLAHWNTPENNQIAKKWIGKECYDCSGIIVWSLQHLGLILVSQDYTADGLYYQLCNPISKADLIPGDLVFIKPNGKEIDHVGIYAGNGKTVEAMGTRYGVVQGDASRFNVFGRLKFDLEVSDNMDWKAIIEKVSAGRAADWEKGINSAVAAAKADGNLGDLEIFQYLPNLIEAIYKMKG